MLQFVFDQAATFAFHALAFLFVLTIIVFVHEFGHFIVARWNGVKVQSFAIGFGKEIFGINDRYGTRWKLGWLPLGGYVRFEGDANAASLPKASSLENREKVPRQFLRQERRAEGRCRGRRTFGELHLGSWHLCGFVHDCRCSLDRTSGGNRAARQSGRTCRNQER